MSKLTIYLSREKCFYPFHQTSRNGGSVALTDLLPPFRKPRGAAKWSTINHTERLPFVWKIRKLRGEFKWNGSSRGKFSGKKVIPLHMGSCTFRVITFFLFLPKRPKFSVPSVWITSARLHVQRKRKLYRYFVNGTTQSRSCFRCQKKYQYHLTEIFQWNFRANWKRSLCSTPLIF